MYALPKRGSWRLISLVLAMFSALPLLLIFSAWLQPENSVWQHLSETVLPGLIANTFVLMSGVAIGVTVLGVGLAWLTTMTEFPGRRYFEWALMLPLAVPAYVLAFVALGFFDYSGPLQSFIRACLGADIVLPDIRSSGGVIIVMSLVLYPYVYMLARSAFLTQGQDSYDSARLLGMGRWQVFFWVALPMARPAIIAGVSLALMETLADFGTVAIFNYDTFTTAIYKAWFGLFNLQAASQLASLLLLIVALALIGERKLRGRARYHTAHNRKLRRYKLTCWQGWAACTMASSVLFLAFLLPVIQLLVWCFDALIGSGSGTGDLNHRYLNLLWHTVLLGVSAMVLTCVGALLLAFARRSLARHKTDWFISGSITVATLGYALPGSVLAVGVMISITHIDEVLSLSWQFLTGLELKHSLAGTIAALLMAYFVRFLAVAFGPIDSGLERIRPSLIESARTLGLGSGKIFIQIYWPLLRPGLLTASLLVLVDVMKEMPATLLLRPFSWDTLAVRIYEMTSEGEWERAALPAITLIIIGVFPVILLVRQSSVGVES